MERRYRLVMYVEVNGNYFDYESTLNALQADDIAKISGDVRDLGEQDRKYKIHEIECETY